MPFSNHEQFDTALRAEMSEAYDAVCAQLHIDAANPLSGNGRGHHRDPRFRRLQRS